MSAIKIDKVVKRYGHGPKANQVIHGVSADIANGEFIVIVGPSGCGKSTLLRMVAGLEEISEGQISIGGRVVNDVEPSDRDIAMVFQNYALYPHMSVFENMAYGLKIAKVPKAEIEARVQKAARILALDGLLDRAPRALSGGQRQRVAMGRAIVRQPQAFLFDEPLSNLDAKLRAQTRLEIQKLHAELGVTSLFVTHDQVEAMTLAQRMIVMNAGRVEQMGTPEQVYGRPATRFVAGFIGSPPMNLVQGSVQAGCFAAPGLRLAGFGKFSHADVVLGVRAEDLVVSPPDDTAGFNGTVFSFELTGDATLVTLRVGSQLVTAKAGKVQRAVMGQPLCLHAAAASCHLFDAGTGLRITEPL